LASEAKPTANLSNAETNMLKKLISTKNQKVIINDTDKNVEPSISDKEDVISECNRQLCDISVYRKLDSQGVQKLILEVKKRLLLLIQKYMAKNAVHKRKLII
jgi:chaperonin cofactor prefoldin